MSAAWVAATVRVRALAAGRAGPVGAARVAAARSLTEVADLLAVWSYGARVADATTPAGLQRATRETLLWQLRVLAGWVPASGTGMLRAAAAEFERDNILMRIRELEGGEPEPAYDLGALASGWSLLRLADSADALRGELSRTVWGGVAEDDRHQLPDVLSAAWLQRCTATAPAARTWAARRAALIAARVRFVDKEAPGPTLRRRLGPLLGSGWESAADLGEFTEALPRRVRPVLADIGAEDQLWRAEARAHALVETEATALLRSGTPRAEAVVAGVALLAVDAWRVQAALAAVEAGSGAREVLDAAA